MMLQEVAYSWACFEDVPVSKPFHYQDGQKRSQVFKFLVGQLTTTPTNFRNIRAYILIALGQLMLRIMAETNSWDLIVCHLGVFRHWLDRTTGLTPTLETHGQKENIILNALLFGGIYTHGMPPEKALLQNWTHQFLKHVIKQHLTQSICFCTW